MKKIKFYVCEHCGSIMQSTGECQVICCGKPIKALTLQNVDNTHSVNVTEIDGDFYIEFNHEMTKEHFISFVSYVGFDRMLTVRLYPEQDATVRFSKMYRGKLYYYCNNHGLFMCEC